MCRRLLTMENQTNGKELENELGSEVENELESKVLHGCLGSRKIRGDHGRPNMRILRGATGSQEKVYWWTIRATLGPRQ